MILPITLNANQLRALERCIEDLHEEDVSVEIKSVQEDNGCAKCWYEVHTDTRITKHHLHFTGHFIDNGLEDFVEKDFSNEDYDEGSGY